MKLLLLFACVTKEPIPSEESKTTKKMELNSAEQQALETEAISIVKKFGGQLKPKLQEAMKEGGPENAIEICSEHAPKIARELSQETGWTVKRVSLKNRNPNGAPDAWEKITLEHWDKELEKGVDADTLTQGELENGQFRFMKAQKTEGLCLTCHGEMIAPNLLDKLNEKYPKDIATGYKLGQIRGAFSVSKNLN